MAAADGNGGAARRNQVTPQAVGKTKPGKYMSDDPEPRQPELQTPGTGPDPAAVEPDSAGSSDLVAVPMTLDDLRDFCDAFVDSILGG